MAPGRNDLQRALCWLRPKESPKKAELTDSSPQALGFSFMGEAEEARVGGQDMSGTEGGRYPEASWVSSRE